MKETSTRGRRQTVQLRQTANTVLTPVAYFAYMTPFHSPSIEQKDFLSFGELNRKETIYISLKLKAILLKVFRRTWESNCEVWLKQLQTHFTVRCCLSRGSLLGTVFFRGCVTCSNGRNTNTTEENPSVVYKLHQSSGPWDDSVTVWPVTQACPLLYQQ